MEVRVLYFASLRERRGRAEERVAVEPGCTVQELYARLFPPGADGALPVAFTVDRAVVPGSKQLEDGAEVSFLPPLGGG